ncbi:MAG: DUF1905 domain-containing protein [Chitinophagaceae bacterium]|nr:DUF1905 domain-containing protein [Chitinophagaceae bacterium]
MVQFTAIIQKFGEKGDKTGWTYIELPADLAAELNPGVRKSYHVKGLLDKHPIAGVTILPMGGGSYILPINAAMRKGVAKKEGAMLSVQLQKDDQPYELNALLVEGLSESDKANSIFFAMPRSHQNIYSKYIDAAKTPATQQKRIIQIVILLERGLSYGEMLREQAAQNRQR